MSGPELQKLTRPSMAEVARLAGVSTQTVSRYLNETGYVSVATKHRIAEAVGQLGYVPNRAARSLRTTKSDTVGVLLVGALNFGASGVLRGITRAARIQGVSIVVTQLDLRDDVDQGWEDEALAVLKHLLGSRVDGVIVSSPISGVERFLDGWSASVPVVVATEATIFSDIGGLVSHSYDASFLATRHLIDLGHTAITHVAGPTTRIEAQERIRGYRQAMSEAGLSENINYGATDWTASSGYDAGQDFNVDGCTGVVAANDEIALGFMHAMEDKNLRAPSDYSITGIDDMPEAKHFSPPLTTVSLDFEALGVRIFNSLEETLDPSVQRVKLPINASLVVRKSTRQLWL